MRSSLIALSAASAILFYSTIAAFAATPPNATEMQPLHYLIGTWHCIAKTSRGTQSEDQVFEPALDGAWLQEREVISGADGQTSTVSIHYTGYDPEKHQFIHVGPDADGSYELAHSADGDTWHDANNSSASFTHTKVSDTQRTMLENYVVDGTPKSVAMTCVKAR